MGCAERHVLGASWGLSTMLRFGMIRAKGLESAGRTEDESRQPLRQRDRARRSWCDAVSQ